MFQQGFAWWSATENGRPAPDLLETAAAIGYRGVDFLPEPLWPEARKCGLKVTIIDGHEPIEVGFNQRQLHADLFRQVRVAVEKAAGEGIPFVAVTSGDCVGGGEGPGDAMSACVEGLTPLAEGAASMDVTLLIEPLNTKVDHPGHECATTAWAAELVRRVESPGIRILYDFYHAQIMEGDLQRTVEENWAYIAHLHTAGVPGRREPTEGQEINYRHIASWLRAAGYTGYVTHEFLPEGDVKASLRSVFEHFQDGDGG